MVNVSMLCWRKATKGKKVKKRLKREVHAVRAMGTVPGRKGQDGKKTDLALAALAVQGPERNEGPLVLLPNAVAGSPKPQQASGGAPLPPPPSPPQVQPLEVTVQSASTREARDGATVRQEQVVVRTTGLDSVEGAALKRAEAVQLDPEEVYRECADRARGVCGKGAVTHRYRTAAYTFCLLWCTLCAVLVLAYGVQFGDEAATWLTLWGDAILLDVLLIKPVMILAGVFVDELLRLGDVLEATDEDLDIDMDTE
jgi:hypothetical protein